MRKKIKVMQIMPEFDLAGAEIMAENLITALDKNEFSVSAVSMYDLRSPITERLEEQGIKIHYLGKSKGVDIRIITRLFRLFKKERPDAVHTHRYLTVYAIPPAILLGIPVKVHTVHNMAVNEAGWLYRKINSLFYKYFKLTPVALTQLAKISVMNEYGLENRSVRLVMNGINLDGYERKRSYKFEGNRIKILHIGRFSKQKNHSGLLDAFEIIRKKHPGAELHLVGSGELEYDIRQKVDRLNLDKSVKFLGKQACAMQFLREADIFVLPSLWEGAPVTLIEAMASGLPIVAADTGGIPDIIEDRVTGLLADPVKDQIARAIEKLIGDRDMRRNLGKSAEEASKQFSSRIMAEKYQKIYKDLLEASGR